MKRILTFGALALTAAFVFSAFTMFSPVTDNKAFAAAFGGDNKKTADESGPTGAYNFDKAHSFIGFKIKHYGLIEVPGFFRDFTGTVNYDATDVSKSTVNFTAKVTSIDTGVAPRDNHLRTADFFEVDKYPDITFKSTKVEKKGKEWMVTGDFTMKDVTKSISFPFQIAGFKKAQNGSKMGITAETVINRQDYNVKYSQALPDGTLGVDNNVKIVLQIEANMAGPKPAETPAKQ
jgi:polyisoprenoid-binding protein YceI